MASLKSAMTFVRWRLVPVRYIGKLAGTYSPTNAAGPRLQRTSQIETDGHAPGPDISPELVRAIADRFADRIHGIAPKMGGHPFVNLLQADDLTSENPALQLAFSNEILDVADDYFDGRFILDSVQLLHSWPTESPEESQLWHRDYGDNRSLHCLVYLSDVLDDNSGPFTFVDKHDSRRIKRSPFIRRINDQQFQQELGSGVIRQMLGRSGTSVWVDPSTCYHYGSRCKSARLALFITFNSDRPFVGATNLVRDNSARLLKAATELRPDLDPAYLARMVAG